LNPRKYRFQAVLIQSVGIIHIWMIGAFDMFTLLRSIIGFLIGVLTLGYLLFIFTLGIRLYGVARPEEAPKKDIQDIINLIIGVCFSPFIIYFLLIGVFNYMVSMVQHIS